LCNKKVKGLVHTDYWERSHMLMGHDHDFDHDTEEQSRK